MSSSVIINYNAFCVGLRHLSLCERVWVNMQLCVTILTNILFCISFKNIHSFILKYEE